LKEYKHRGYTFGAWVYRIATNHLIDYYRRASRKKELAIESIQDQPVNPPNPSDPIEEQQNKELVQKIINQLPKRYQAIINLKYFAEMSPEEIAASLSVSLTNARVLAHRALKKFHQLYQKYGQ
jgi:RNA polymerase sigma-70 factor (ECF subfamily)